MITKKKLQDAINNIIKCSLGKWYVGRTDGKSEEVVLLDDVLSILMTLINEKNDKDWIPVTKKLPEKQDEYLVTWKMSNVDTLFLQILEYDILDKTWILEEYMKTYKDVEITAWKPLPQPYKEGK